MRTHHHGRPPQNIVSYMSKEYRKLIWKEFRVRYMIGHTILLRLFLTHQYQLNPIATGNELNQPIYSYHVTQAGRNRVN